MPAEEAAGGEGGERPIESGEATESVSALIEHGAAAGEAGDDREGDFRDVAAPAEDAEEDKEAVGDDGDFGGTGGAGGKDGGGVKGTVTVDYDGVASTEVMRPIRMGIARS